MKSKSSRDLLSAKNRKIKKTLADLETIKNEAHRLALNLEISTSHLEQNREEYKSAMAEYKATIKRLYNELTKLKMQLSEHLRIESQRKFDVDELRRSTTFKIGQAIVDAASSPRGFLRLPKSLLRLYLEYISRSKNYTPDSDRGISDITHVARQRDSNINCFYERWKQKYNASMVVTPDVLKAMRVATIMDTFTYHAFSDECELLQLSPSNWAKELENFKPDFLFIESAWRGKDDLWYNNVGPQNPEILGIVEWCKSRGTPTIFWNKEDPGHFNTFLGLAAKCDFVFTSDIDCVKRYKMTLCHENVFYLPFSSQTKRFNPIEKYKRKDEIVFAGSYYRKFPERCRDMNNLMSALAEVKPLTIYDRYFNSNNIDYSFPKEFKKYISGILPFDEIDKAYKGYKYSINITTAKQSQGMFARRVVELMACNTTVISNFSMSQKQLFGDLLLSSDNGNWISKQLKVMSAHPVLLEKRNLTAVRKILTEHTSQDRLAYIVSRIFSLDVPDLLPDVIVLGFINDSVEEGKVLSSFNKQLYVRKQLVLIREPSYHHNCGGQNRGGLKNGAIDIIDRDSIRNYLNGLNVSNLNNPWVAVMDPQDFYGKAYLTDLALATRYTDAKVIGKGTYYFLNSLGYIVEEQSGLEFTPTNKIAARRAIIKAEALQHGCIDNILTFSGSEFYGLPESISIDKYNYCAHGADIDKESDLGRTLDNSSTINSGSAVLGMQLHAERLFQESKNHEQRQTFTASKLYSLFGTRTPKEVNACLKENRIYFCHTFPKDKHDVWLSSNLLNRSEIEVKDGIQYKIDVIAVCSSSVYKFPIVYFNQNYERIGHEVVPANIQTTITIPLEAEYLKIGVWMKGIGEGSLKQITFSQRSHSHMDILGLNNYLIIYEKKENEYVNIDFLAEAEFSQQFDRYFLEKDIIETIFGEQLGQSYMIGGLIGLDSLLSNKKYIGIVVRNASSSLLEYLAQNVVNTSILVTISRTNIDEFKCYPFWQTTKDKSGTLSLSIPKQWRLVFDSQHTSVVFFHEIGVSVDASLYNVAHFVDSSEMPSFHDKNSAYRKMIVVLAMDEEKGEVSREVIEAISAIKSKKFFSSMRFTIIGSGDEFESLVSPLRRHLNVIIVSRLIDAHQQYKLAQYNGVIMTSNSHERSVDTYPAKSFGLVDLYHFVEYAMIEKCRHPETTRVVEKLIHGLEMLNNNPAVYLQALREKSTEPPQNSPSSTAINTVKDIIHSIQDSEILNIAINLDSNGLGDLLISMAWLDTLRRSLPCRVKFDLFGKPKGALPFIASMTKNIQNVFSGEYFSEKRGYDLKIAIHYFIVPVHYDMATLKAKAVGLEKIISRLLTFNRRNLKYIKFKTPRHGEWAKECVGNKYDRWSSLNASDTLSFDRSCKTFVKLDSSDLSIIERNNLSGRMYITLHRGIDSNARVEDPSKLVKVWPKTNAEEFVRIFKKKFPDICIVLLGTNPNLRIDGADLDLIGKTTLSEAACLLKHSSLHIDGESGFVHLRRQLEGKSIVLFGPTPVEYFGYPENINLTSGYCEGCMWWKGGWHVNCRRGHERPRCLELISAATVLDAATILIQNVPSYKFRVKHIEFFDQSKVWNEVVPDTYDSDISESTKELAYNNKSVTQYVSETLASSSLVAIIDSDDISLASTLAHFKYKVTYYAEPKDSDDDSSEKADILKEFGVSRELSSISNIRSDSEVYDLVMYKVPVDFENISFFNYKELLRIVKNEGSLLLYSRDGNVSWKKLYEKLSELKIDFSSFYNRSIMDNPFWFVEIKKYREV